MSRKAKGTLIIIGGREDKERDCVILQDIAERTKRHGDRLVLMTVATQLPEEVAADYVALFKQLGVSKIDVVDIRTREDAQDPKKVALIEKTATVFFTGGDQLRITSQIGDTATYTTLMEFYEHGGIMVGTSAGAAVMSETMLVSGASDQSPSKLGPEMSPGLGYLTDVVIDSHFAERGRIGRLLGAVALNPRNIGVGIDEDTAIIINGGREFLVRGSGAVYVVDGSTITASNLSEKDRDGLLSITDVKLHLLADGDRFDLATRQPIPKVVETESKES
jgi:cyanophycinase